jgi:hypothetical protein
MLSDASNSKVDGAPAPTPLKTPLKFKMYIYDIMQIKILYGSSFV